MTRGKQDKLYRSFTKGLITEAGFLTYPEDASTDELNTVISRKGNRSRRFGLDYEDNATGISFSGANPSATAVTTEYFWRAPGNKASLNFLVVQMNNKLYFFDASKNPLSSGKKSFTVDLQKFISPTAVPNDVANTHVQMSGGKGWLFVAQEHIDPFTIEYDPKTDTINTIRIYILMRDFDGLNDNLSNDAEPTVLSKEHKYNLRNQGWVPPGSPSVQTSVPGNPTGSGTAPSTASGQEGSASDGDGSSNSYYNPWTGIHRGGDSIGGDIP